MKNKPIIVPVITLGLLLVPITYLLRIWLDLNKNPLQMSALGFLLFTVITVLSLIIAFGVWRVRRWGFYSLLLFGVLTTILDLYTLKEQNFEWSWWLLLDLAAAGAGLLLILQEDVRKPYFNPQIRWWETAERIRTDVPGTVFFKNQKEEILILDVSTTGCFAELDSPLDVGQIIIISIYHLLFKFESEAVVVRKNDTPSGYGIKFENTTGENKKIMKKILKSLKSN
jgi:hypothetical protein